MYQELKKRIYQYPRLYTDSNKVNKSLLRKNSEFMNSELYDDICNATKFLGDDVSPSMRLYCILNDIIEYPLCAVCDSPVSFKRGKGFNEFCSVKCGSSSKSTSVKRKKTNLQKYGVNNVSQAEIIKEKRIKTYNELYGVDNIFQSDIIKEKITETNLQKYGY